MKRFLLFLCLFPTILLAGTEIKETKPAPTAPPALPPVSFDSWWNGPTLSYDWFAQGDTMRAHGVYLMLNLNQYGQGLVSGNGSKDFAYGGKLDGILHLEGQQMGTWKGLSLDSHMEFLYGRNVLNNGGMVIPVNTALLLPKAGQTIVTLSSLFLTQKIGDQFSMSVGRFNTIDFTAFNPYDGGAGNTFWNLAFIAPLVQAKTVPAVTNGGLMKFDTKHNIDLTLGVFDPQDSSTTTGLPELFDNGVTLLGVVTVKTKVFDLAGMQSVTGTWSNLTAPATGQLRQLLLPTVFGPVANKTGTWSIAYHLEQAIYAPKDNPANAVGLFGNIGVSDGNPNPVKWSATAGLGGHSPIPGREEDRLGVGYYYLGFSNAIKNQLLLSTRLRDEQGVEMFYTASLNKWWTVTADLQVVDPCTTRNETATVLGFSTGIKF